MWSDVPSLVPGSAKSVVVARPDLTRALVAVVAMALFDVACAKMDSGLAPTAPAPPTPSMIRRSEALAAQRDAERVPCRGAATLYDGSIAVDAHDYVQSRRGADDVGEDIAGLDSIVSPAAQLRFHLDYPFEKPYVGTVTGGITLRKVIDAVRAGFRKMYEGTSQRDIPGVANKEVTGPYGRAFHGIGDLVITHIALCDADGTLEIDIES
jgi:hypothetical protein